MRAMGGRKRGHQLYQLYIYSERDHVLSTGRTPWRTLYHVLPPGKTPYGTLYHVLSTGRTPLRTFDHVFATGGTPFRALYHFIYHRGIQEGAFAAKQWFSVAKTKKNLPV